MTEVGGAPAIRPPTMIWEKQSRSSPTAYHCLNLVHLCTLLARSVFCSRRAHVQQVTAAHGANMSLIKSADVPKHMADRLRSRRIAARLSGGAAKQPMTARQGSHRI